MKIKNIEKRKYEILLALFMVSLVSSTILLINLLNSSLLICGVSEGCSAVSESVYSETFGIQNEYLGFVFFLFLSILTFIQLKNPDKNKRVLIHIGTIMGGVWAIYSLYLMEFVINAYCKYCTIIDISSLIALAIAIVFWKR